MNSEKRLIVFFVLSFLALFGTQYALDALGLLPKRRPAEPPPLAAAEEEGAVPAEAGRNAFAGEKDGPGAFAEGAAEAPSDSETPSVAAAPPKADDAPRVPEEQLVLGNLDSQARAEDAYHLRVALDQRGAGVRSIELAYHDAELTDRRREREPLTLVDVSPRMRELVGAPPLGLGLVPIDPGNPDVEPVFLGDRLWTVVPDDSGRIVRPLTDDPERGLREGQVVVFRAEVPSLSLAVVKSIGLRKGRDAVDVALRIESSKPQSLILRVQGPYGVPVEGDWYTSTFREVFFGKLAAGGATEVETKAAGEILDRERKGDPIRATTLPLKYAGVENQYFAVFLQPDPLPTGAADRIDEKTVATIVEPAEPTHKSEVSLYLETKPITLAADKPAELGFHLFAGPKTPGVLEPYGAEDLATYRKGWQFPVIGPVATWIAKNAIGPLLDQIHGLTTAVARVFGGSAGNYGIAIILLTFVVRSLMFPLSKKQAESAKRMQDLQPQLVALKEKYKDDKEKIGQATFALYRANGVNPFGGCVLVLIQMPIFLGLWQAVNNSVALRNASFLWIQNLAAPDQLFKFPMEVPWLGPYFNVLPLVVAGLMLVHTKLFSPPATTPEQEQSQKIMKYMLVVMAFMFYRVPAGLCLYFITSSLWSIGERTLLPKMASKKPVAVVEPPPSSPARRAARAADAKAPAPSGWRDRLRDRLEQVMDEAAKDKTVRRTEPPRNGGGNGGVSGGERRRPKGPPSSGRSGR